MKKFLFILIGFFAVLAGFAQTAFDAEALLKPRTGTQQLVNDYANILTPDQKQALEDKLVAFDDSSSTQIAVVIVPNLGGNDVSDFNVKLGRAWGVGGSQFNNGVVLLISMEDHKLNIATGYGAEGALPDITAKHIIDDVITPNLKGQNYYRGIDEGTDAMILALRGEYNVARSTTGRVGGRSRLLFYLMIVVIILVISRRKNGGGGSYMSRRGGTGLAQTLFWSSMLGGGGGGGWSGGGGSSGGGGGFGGFGGGSFGGGGASGSW